MHQPAAFRVDDRAAQHALMTRHPFATLIAVLDGAPEVSHVPLALDPAAGPFGTLRGHLARPNPLARRLSAGEALDVLCVFTGPQGYVSPDWYANPANQVPTWNYAVVHAWGRMSAVAPDALPDILAAQSALHEAALPKKPWTMDKVAPHVRDALLRGVVGVEIAVTRIDAKFKLSQNKAPADVAEVVGALRDLGDEANRDLAAAMEAVCIPAGVDP